MAMFSQKLERRRRIQRWAFAVSGTLLVVGLVLIAYWTVQALDMLEAADTDRVPVISSVLIALGVLVLVCLFAYGAIQAYGRVTSR